MIRTSPTTSAAIRVQLRASNHTHPSLVEPRRRTLCSVQESELGQQQAEVATAATENVELSNSQFFNFGPTTYSNSDSNFDPHNSTDRFTSFFQTSATSAYIASLPFRHPRPMAQSLPTSSDGATPNVIYERCQREKTILFIERPAYHSNQNNITRSNDTKSIKLQANGPHIIKNK